jgi:hypothetical protein
MKKQIDPQHLINSAALEFADFKPFSFAKTIKDCVLSNWESERRMHLSARFRDFLINEVIVRVEKSYFTLNCSVAAMALLERMVDYAWIEHGVGTLLLASCEVVVKVDFDLAVTTIMYHVVDPKSEQTLATYVIAE